MKPDDIFMLAKTQPEAIAIRAITDPTDAWNAAVRFAAQTIDVYRQSGAQAAEGKTDGAILAGMVESWVSMTQFLVSTAPVLVEIPAGLILQWRGKRGAHPLFRYSARFHVRSCGRRRPVGTLVKPDHEWQEIGPRVSVDDLKMMKPESCSHCEPDLSFLPEELRTS